jgi:hypothetical protein
MRERLIQEALIRNFEIIGEAANRLSAEQRSQQDIPWSRIIAFRNRLAALPRGTPINICGRHGSETLCLHELTSAYVSTKVGISAAVQETAPLSFSSRRTDANGGVPDKYFSGCRIQPVRGTTCTSVQLMTSGR